MKLFEKADEWALLLLMIFTRFDYFLSRFTFDKKKRK